MRHGELRERLWDRLRRRPRPVPMGDVPMNSPQPPGLARFLWLFPVWLAVGFGLLETHYGRPVVDAWTRWLVQASALAIRISGGSAAAHGNILQNPSTGFSIAVEDTCNASNVVVLLCAAVLAFPATWGNRLRGITAGTLILLAVNLLRIISLFYLGQYDPAWFEFAHLYVWEGLMMIVTLVLFWMWVQYSREKNALVTQASKAS